MLILPGIILRRWNELKWHLDSGIQARVYKMVASVASNWRTLGSAANNCIISHKWQCRYFHTSVAQQLSHVRMRKTHRIWTWGGARAQIRWVLRCERNSCWDHLSISHLSLKPQKQVVQLLAARPCGRKSAGDRIDTWYLVGKKDELECEKYYLEQLRRVSG